MSRFSFRTFDGHHTSIIKDIECEGVQAVRLQMLEIAGQEMKTIGGDSATWSMEALDNRGLVVGSMDFGISSSTDYRR